MKSKKHAIIVKVMIFHMLHPKKNSLIVLGSLHNKASQQKIEDDWPLGH